MSLDESHAQDASPGSQGDDRLVHALLLHLHDPQAVAQRERRVQSALTAIRTAARPADTAPRVLRFPKWARRSLAAAAALLILAIGIWLLTTTSTPAMASIADILTSLGRPGDRTYHIQMIDLPEPSGSGGPEEPGRLPKPGLDDATLYLRDGKQYLLVRHDPNSPEPILDGFDGQRRWSMHRGILDETQAGRGGIPMPALMADVPFSELPQTLDRIRVDYRIEALDEARLAAGGELLRHVRVRRNSRAVKGPETIEIWADTQTALPRRIVFDDAKIQGNRAPCRLVLDLVSAEGLASGWFAPAGHVTGQAVPSKK